MPDYLYHWRTKDSILDSTARMTVKPKTTTTYYLTQKDFRFFETSDSVTITVEVCERPLEIPNVFTPNGDGRNDELFIKNPDKLPYTIQIFNRWGMLVFEGSEKVSWDGNISASSKLTGSGKADEGVYYYLARTRLKEGKIREVSGSVTLVR